MMGSALNDTQYDLINAFKELMDEHPFKKITIKMITDKANVIRPTFYKYFQDKYQLFEIILDDDLFDALYDLLQIDLYKEALTMIFSYFDKNHIYYQKAFDIDGQNSFTELLVLRFKKLFKFFMAQRRLKLTETAEIFEPEQVAILYSINITSFLQIWLQNYEKVDRPVEEIIKFYIFIVSHDINDIFETNEE